MSTERLPETRLTREDHRGDRLKRRLDERARKRAEATMFDESGLRPGLFFHAQEGIGISKRDLPSPEDIQEIDRLAEEGKLKPERGLVPIPRGLRTAIWVAAGLGTTGCTGPLMGLVERLIHPPAITEKISAAQEVGVPPEAEEAPEYFERASPEDFLVQIQAPEPIVPSEKPPEVETVTSYEVQPGDTLTAIAKKFGLPWPALYGKNIILIGENPGSIRVGDTFVIPDKEKDRELIKALTPREIPEPEFGVGGPEEASRYFPETGHYISGPFLEFFETYGLDVLGLPISEQLGTVKLEQYFQRMSLSFSETDPFSYLPDRPKYDSPGPHIYPKPIGWTLYYYRQGWRPGRDPEFPTVSGEFELAEEFRQFYESRGGAEILGRPISKATWENGVLIQWLFNTRLEFRPENLDPYKVQLGLTGQEYVETILENEAILERQPQFLKRLPTQTEVLSTFAKENPEKLRELQARAVAAVVYKLNDYQSSFGDRIQERDYFIVCFQRFDKILGVKTDERPFDYQTALMTLAWEEARYKENLVVRQVLTEMISGTKAINKLLVDKLSPELFKEGTVPQLPEDLQEMSERIVFAGGYETLGKGEAKLGFVVLFGRYDLLGITGSNDIEKARSTLSGNIWREIVRSLVQTQLREQESPLWKERRYILRRLSMGSIEAVSEEAVGLGPRIDPRIIYLYTRLKNAGVEDPYGLLIRTAVTANE
ncbi:MAG: hypothetical protein LiPW16_423, partial [Microgenomates group bacterium LiPW_16]